MSITVNASSKRLRGARVLMALAAIVLMCSVIACIASAPARAATSSTCNLYASNSGSDSNPGTVSKPFATAKHLMEKLSAGQTGCLASGQTFAGFTLYEGDTHGAEGAPITLTSTNPEEPATLDGRVTTEKGSNWLTFTHLDFVYGQETLLPTITIGAAHTSWTYDEVNGANLNICFLTNPPGDSYGTGEYTLIENDRVHNCGHPVTKTELEAQASDEYEGRENGWHVHGLYDEGVHTTVRNSYFYDSSGVGILLRSGGFAVVEHNVIDGNGRGVEIGNEGSEDDTVAWNIITNATSPCGHEAAGGSHCDTYGLLTNGSVGPGSVFRDNDLYGNEGGNIEPGINSIVARAANIEVNPLYTDAANHEYTLEPGSPAIGYGPDTVQPTSTSFQSGESTSASPPAEESTSASPPAKTEESTSASPPAKTGETKSASPPAKTEAKSTSSPTKTTPSGPSKVGRHKFFSTADRGSAKTASVRSHAKRHHRRTKHSKSHK